MSDAQNQKKNMPDAVELSHAVAAIAERSQRVVADFLAKQTEAPMTGNVDPMNIAGAFFEMTAKLMVDPTHMVQAQMSLWSDYMRLWQQTTEKFLGVTPQAAPVIAPNKGDKRFKDAAWEENALFDFIKQSYLLSARFLQHTVKDVNGLDDQTARKVDFYTRQFVDAMAPSNFVFTNPEVLRTTVESGGENLLKGLEHMLDDLERGKGKLAIRMTDMDQFELGKNIALSAGQVVFQNDLMQLIQYNPTTDKVRRRPLLIIPPWINKFYILDLRPKNSFIRWALDEGHTVFVISWVNPDGKLANKSFEDYMQDGPLAALDAIEAATGEREANLIGYCIGGTLLAVTLAYMAAMKDDRVASATYFTTMVDFSEAGELSVFIDEDQLLALEAKMAEAGGVLQGSEMAGTFNSLRANDLVWSFVVNNYLLGKEPFPFDLLYWNSDSTAMPSAMHSFYLRNMYQQNRLIQPGGVAMKNTPIDLRKIDTPSFVLATKDDHIAPWKSCYAGSRLYHGPVKFCLAGSGHIAGVVNPPEANKYGYWISRKSPEAATEWLDSAEQREGSWWVEWSKWVEKYAGGRVPARIPGDGSLKVIEAAPGSYVKRRAS